jgi:hypothetical protein
MTSVLNILRHPFRYFDLWFELRALSEAADLAYANFANAAAQYGVDHERVDHEKAILDSIRTNIEQVQARMTKIKKGRT